jgi:transcription antitermination factor NusG
MCANPYPIEQEGGSTAQESEKSLRHWFAVYTASHNEKAVERALRQKGLETYLPLYSVTKRWKNRTTVKLDLPLFAGYVFARIALSESAVVRSVPRVFSIIGNSRGPLPLPEAEIEALRAGLDAHNVTPCSALNVGERARIIRGPLAGWDGIIVRTNGKFEIILSVEMISRSIAVRVDAEEIAVYGQDASSQRELLSI